MYKFYFCALCIVIFNGKDSSVWVSGQAPDTLRLVQLLNRHGDRTPSGSFPTDVYTEADWPNGYSQLTQLGMRQMRTVGEYLRATYGGFLNSTYVKEEIYVRSTDKDRTLMSAAALLAGLYPPAGFQQWADDIQWQPVPVHTRPIEDDYQIAEDAPCKKYEDMYADALMSSEAYDLREQYQDQLDYVATSAGFTEPTLPLVWDLYDPLTAMAIHNMSVPDWATSDALDFVGMLAAVYECKFKHYTADMRRLKVGPFLALLSARLRQARDGEPEPQTKMDVYLSHDKVISGLLMALGVVEHTKVPFAAGLLWELHQDAATGEYSVQMYYRNSTDADDKGEAIALPDCDGSTSCPLDTFLAMLEPLSFPGSLDQWRAECDYGYYPGKGGVVAAALLFVLVLVLTLVIVVMMIRARTKAKEYERV